MLSDALRGELLKAKALIGGAPLHLQVAETRLRAMIGVVLTGGCVLGNGARRGFDAAVLDYRLGVADLGSDYLGRIQDLLVHWRRVDAQVDAFIRSCDAESAEVALAGVEGLLSELRDYAWQCAALRIGVSFMNAVLQLLNRLLGEEGEWAQGFAADDTVSAFLEAASLGGWVECERLRQLTATLEHMAVHVEAVERLLACLLQRNWPVSEVLFSATASSACQVVASLEDLF